MEDHTMNPAPYLRALRAAGFTVRQGKHYVWRHPSGIIVVIARTPSDQRAITTSEPTCGVRCDESVPVSPYES
jgi:hypothetical protein